MLYEHNRTICCQILCQVGNEIAFDLHGCRRPGESGRGSWVYTGSMINKIRVKTTALDLFFREIFRQLVNDGSNHLQVAQFFCTCSGFKMDHRNQIYRKQNTNGTLFLDTLICRSIAFFR